jgi:predicted GIY-YIG superfamily endonuclease
MPSHQFTYVYILRSLAHPDRIYIGYTADLRDRLARHNRGAVPHTARFAPWALQTYLGFADKEQAMAFEAYLKSGSGRAFLHKRLA